MADTDSAIKQVGAIDVDSFWLPRQLSTIAGEVDTGFAYANWVWAIFFTGVVSALVAFVVLYRRKRPGEMPERTGHNTPLEITWTVLPFVVVMGLFLVGFKGWMNSSVAPAGAYEIQVQAAKWLWTFTYPNGVVTTDELRVPVGRPVRLVMSSRDVLHSLYIPTFRVKNDLIPGSYTSVWFEATEVAETPLECTEYCGTNHSNMLAKVVVMAEDDFNGWLEAESGPGPGADPAEYGKTLFVKNACATCHSVDGTKLTGPSFKGLYGRDETLTTGTVKVDENYIRESILNPQAKVVAGYPPVMPTFKGVLDDKKIDALIAYLKTLQ
jgi:cytochrome c oxidase subunit 2